jgi:cyclopropane fatty-acyl-phospholipid synthase-like methyltransferase
MPFSNKDITDYYNQTLNHYTMWWKLSSALSVHYGMWFKGTKSFVEALKNTNREMCRIAGITSEHAVLDAGCGVGGAAFFLAEQIGCHVTGITLSQKQLGFAEKIMAQSSFKQRVLFDLQDFTKTSFPENSFDIVWACESSCYANPKMKLIEEVFRVLKPGGKFILCDYFLTEEGKVDSKEYIRKWGETWAISQFNTDENFITALAKNKFNILQNIDYTKAVFPTSKRMYLSYLLGFIPSNLYNISHKTSRFAKTHYLSGKYQYLALKQNLWTYRMILAQKV